MLIKKGRERAEVGSEGEVGVNGSVPFTTSSVNTTVNTVVDKVVNTVVNEDDGAKATDLNNSSSTESNGSQDSIKAEMIKTD